MTKMEKSHYPESENGEVTSNSSTGSMSGGGGGDDGGGSGGGGAAVAAGGGGNQEWLYPTDTMAMREEGGPINASNSGSEIAVCAGCNLRIVDKFYLNALDSKWHTSCLKCSECSVMILHTFVLLKEKKNLLCIIFFQMELESQISCYERDGLILCREDYLR